MIKFISFENPFESLKATTCYSRIQDLDTGYIDRGTPIGSDEFRGIGGPHRSLHLMV